LIMLSRTNSFLFGSNPTRQRRESLDMYAPEVVGRRRIHIMS
jgi:hypothetical protein